MSQPAYARWRKLVGDKGGKMGYVRKGFPSGAWVIEFGTETMAFISEGKASFPELDQCYEPKKPNPKSYYDYFGESSFKDECARSKLQIWFGV